MQTPWTWVSRTYQVQEAEYDGKRRILTILVASRQAQLRYLLETFETNGEDIAGWKINLDDNGDDGPDRVALVGMVDVGGLNSTTMKPVNNWKVTYLRYFIPSEIALKSIWTPYVATIDKPELAYQTIRIDEQSQSEWKSSTNPPYRYVTCKEVRATKT